MDGHPWEAVFAAAKALVNYVKERSGRHDLDGAPHVRAVFSKRRFSMFVYVKWNSLAKRFACRRLAH
jgi:hypothetical protein